MSLGDAVTAGEDEGGDGRGGEGRGDGESALVLGDLDVEPEGVGKVSGVE